MLREKAFFMFDYTVSSEPLSNFGAGRTFSELWECFTSHEGFHTQTGNMILDLLESLRNGQNMPILWLIVMESLVIPGVKK